MKRAIRMTRVYPHPPERVWAALTSAEALAVWLMPNDFVAELGHRFTFRTEPAPGFDGIVHCEVLELAAPERMVWSWRGGPIDTRVSFTLTLEAAPDGRASTRLAFAQTGFEGPRAMAVSFILERGFPKMFGAALPAVLAQLEAGEPPTAPPRKPPHPLAAAFERTFAKLIARREPRDGTGDDA
ncbi:MAG: SRPBCC domain-containing protein [Myxococcota bacterium]